MKTKNYFLTLLLAAMMCVPFTANAQVTIGSTELPQAMLDIRAYPEMDERGQGFRLRDGNQAPGRVLTAVCNDGFGTWQNPVTATTIRGTTQQGQNIPLVLNQSDFPSSTPTRFQSQRVVMAPGTFIDLPPGLWRVDLLMGFRIEGGISVAGDWIELFGVFSTNPDAVHFNQTVAFITFAPVTGITLPGAFTRGTGFTFIHNTSGTTQRYYVGIGRATVGNRGGTSSLFGTTITIAQAGDAAAQSIFATSTNFVD